MSNPKIFLQPELIEGDNIDIAQDGKTISSNTPLANITDTDITEVEDGQALIYDETSGKWVNGEGGTPIEPNPAAAATDTLSTIKIDNTVFTIGGGGTGDAVLYPLTTAEYNALTPEQKMDENVLYLLTDGGSGGGGGGAGGGFYAPDYENPETITLTPLTWVTYNVTQNGYVMVDLTAFTETGGTSVKVNGTTLNFDKVDGTNYILNSTYMFPVMANDVVEIRLNYNGSGYGSNTALFFPAKGGGGGGSNIIPNPEDEATDVLHSIKIDDATYAIQGGGSFIDVENRIVAPTEFTTSLTYTATEDCVVCMYLVCPGDASTFVKINDFTVQNFWQAELATGPCAPIFVRTGQTLTVTGAHASYASNYIVYGVQSSGGGGGTGNLNAVEMDYEDWLELPQEEREDPNIEYFLSNAPGGGGSGSEVIPNPQGTATDTLNTVEIDGTIFDLPSGGGESNEPELIWNGDETPTTSGTDITLNKSWQDYDILIFVIYQSSSSFYSMPMLLTKDMNINTRYIQSGYSYSRFDICIIPLSDTVINIQRPTSSGSAVNYKKIYGIKLGGGGGSSEINYSTEEQRIGTWINGKPIYQITLELNVTLNTTSWISVNIDSFVQNIKNIIHFDAMTDDDINTYNITGTIYELQPWQNNGVQMIDIHCTNVAANRVLKYLTIQYTKTTD